jgi:predicted dehydrogenase
MVHQIAWIMGALDLPLPSAAYMSGGVFSEKDGREVPDTIAVTLDFPKDIVVTWQSTFSNKHYELGDHILGSDGTCEHHFEQPLQYWPEKTNRPSGEATNGKTPDQNHMANWIDCIRSRGIPNAPPEIGYRSAIAVHMSNLSYKNKKRITLEEARAIKPEF